MAAISEREDGEEHLDIRLRQDEEMEFFTELALHEAERWISAVTRKKFSHPDDFRKSLENGILLCELLNNLKAGSVKRINKLPGAIAGLDNINVFLKSCREAFGLGTNQLFDTGDLEDLSQRAIADSDNLKQEVDRRSLNVAITIFWLGRSVSQSFSGPHLDQSAFSAIVRYSGKDLLPKERPRNDSVDSSDQTSSAYSSHETNSRVSNDDSLENKHIRDSSCDSFVSKESAPSLDLEDESMPSSVNSKMRRYNSAGSLNTSGGYHFSATSHGINVDDHGNSNSNHHRRGSSTDSMDSSSYLGNHSRQSSDSASVDIPTRTLKTQRKVSSSTVDPLQFVKSKPADVLAKTAQEQIEAAKETRLSRVVIPEKEDVDWQSNLSSWKHRRRRASAAAYQRVEEVDSVGQEEEDKKKPKTYGEMMADRKKRMSTGTLNFYPLDDDDDFLGPKKSDPVEETVQKKELVRQETAPSIRLQQRLSHKNRANSVGSEKPSYEVKEIADWAKDDENENNEKESTDDKQEEKSVAEQTSAPRNTHDDKFNRGKVSDSSKSLNSDSSWKTQSKPDRSTAKKSDDNKSSSVNKISNILKSFEKKEEVDYEKPKKKFEFSVEAGRTRSKWQEREKNESVDAPPIRLSDRPRAKSHPAKDFTEKNIKINLQKPHNTTKGFGFSISGGVEKKQPITVYKVNIGSAADVCDLQMKDIILSVNRKDVATMTQPQVQHIIDMAARQGHVELKIKREMGEDDDLEDETFEEEETTSPQNHSPIWKSPALEPRTHSPKTSTSPATSPSYHSRHREKSPPNHHRPTTDHHRHTDNHTHKERSTPDHHTRTERSIPDHHTDTHRSLLDRHTEKKPDHDRHNDRSTHEHSRRAEKTESSPSYYQRHRDTAPAANSQKSDKVPPPVPAKKTSTHREEVKLEVSVSSRKWEPQPQGQTVEEPKPVANSTADDEPMWIMDKLRAEHEPVKHAPISDPKQPETNNNDVKQESESESESEEEEDEEESPVSPAVREERSPLIETEVVQRPTITVRKNREPEVETPVVAHSFHVQESLPPPPPSEAPPPLRRSNLDEEGFKPPDILKRWQRSTRSGRSSSSNSLDSDADKRLSSSSLHAEFNINQANPGQVEMEATREPRYDATVGQPVTLQISTSNFIIDPRNQDDEEEPAQLPEYSFRVNLEQPKEIGSVLPSRDLHHEQKQFEEEDEKTRRIREKEEQLRKQEEEIRKEKEKLRREQEEIEREKEEIRRQKLEEEKSKHRPVYDTRSTMNGYDKPSDNMTQYSAPQENNQGPKRLGELWAPDPNKDKQRWSREDMLAMNRKATPLQKKPETEAEPETAKEVYHSNSVPKPRTRGGDFGSSRPHRSEQHNPHSHWMVEEAERRRKADNKRHSVHGGPIKPVHPEGLANRWRDDTSIPKQQTYTTNSVISPRSLNTKQFSAEPDRLSQTLPAYYNNSHAPKSENSLRPSRGSPNPQSPSSPPSHAEQIMAVSGKQLCSHCSQELGFGAAMVIESLGLYYHVQCFRCCVCHQALGNGSQGADVRVRVNKLHCRNCYSNDEAGLKFSKV